MKQKGWTRVRSNKNALIVLSLLVAAIALYTFGLGNSALRDWDEGIVAAVARNIWRNFPQETWLYPTIGDGQPYWNKPPLVHWGIAIAYSFWGVSEWSSRIVPTLLSALSVPLVYLIGREVLVAPIAPLFSSLVYLTLLPVARHSRVAMLDGAISCWFCLAAWSLLRGRKQPKWLLGTGLSLGLICLTKGMMMGLFLGGILGLFILWDCPKLLLNRYLWIALVLGVVPAIAWYGLQYLHYGQDFLGISLGKQTFNRIWEPLNPLNSPPWYYLLEILKYGFPWLIFLPQGVKLAWQQRNFSWAKLGLVWTGVYLLAISAMVTKLPWYLMPIYPGLSLLIGASLAHSWHDQQFPPSWRISLSLLAGITLSGGLYLVLVAGLATDLAIILGVAIATLLWSAVFIWRSNRNFIVVLFGGFYLALLLLFNSSHWLWELNEAFPVKPVAELIRQHAPPQQQIYTSYAYFRPSLDFYSDRVIIPASDLQLQQVWQQENYPYLLLEPSTIERLNLQSYQVLGDVLNDVTWLLIMPADS